MLSPVKARGCNGAGVPTALCSWKIHTYRTSCLGAGQRSVPAGRTPGKGRSPSIPFPQQVSQSSFVAGSMSLWRGRFSGSGVVPASPGLSALQPKGRLLWRISQTTHLRLASLRLGSCSHFPSQAQTRGDKLFPTRLIDKSCRTTRKAHSWLPGLPWQETAAQ